MDEEEGGKQGFKIEDKRRFDQKGNQRAEGADERPAARDAAPRAVLSEQPPTPEAADAINFASFVMSLATQCLIQLGEMAAPEGFEIARDPLAARQTIEILKMLEHKTRGNLDNDEARLLKEILSTLQISYVRSAK